MACTRAAVVWKSCPATQPSTAPRHTPARLLPGSSAAGLSSRVLGDVYSTYLALLLLLLQVVQELCLPLQALQLAGQGAEGTEVVACRPRGAQICHAGCVRTVQSWLDAGLAGPVAQGGQQHRSGTAAMCWELVSAGRMGGTGGWQKLSMLYRSTMKPNGAAYRSCRGATQAVSVPAREPNRAGAERWLDYYLCIN